MNDRNDMNDTVNDHGTPDPLEWTMKVLAEVLDASEPVPDDAVSAAYAAIEMRALNDELAALVFDSQRDEQLMAVRGTETEVRLLSFVNDHMSLDLELHADGRTIIGQLTPPSDGPLDLEVATGERFAVVADEFGRFRVTAEGGTIRFRVVGRLITPWISR
jgi:hypothetical protein